MHFKFLGTGSGECIPGIFCNCDICKYARKYGGREIRTRNQGLINDDMLIDWPPDSYSHFIKNNVDVSKIKYLLITHSHDDHLYEWDMVLRGWPYAYDMHTQDLYIYSNKAVLERLKKACDTTEADIRAHIHLIEIEMYKKVKIGKYEVISIPACHMQNEDARLYIIKEKDKTLFYCTDTGILGNEVFDYFVENKIHIDCIAADCTFGEKVVAKGCGHLSIPAIKDMVEMMKRRGIVDDSVKVIATHISHNGGLKYADFPMECGNTNIESAYDGLKIEL